MPLSKQLFPLQFGQGLDTKTDAKLVVPGRLLELENGVFDRVGAIRKRAGHTAITTSIVGGTAVERADGLAVFRDELLLFGDAGRMYSRSEALDGWVDRGAVASVDLRTDPIVRNSYQQTNASSATSGGLTLTTWADSRGGVRYSVRDDSTGAVFVLDEEVSATATGAQVVVWQSEFVIAYVVANNLFYRRVPVASPTTIGVEVNPISTLDPGNAVGRLLATANALLVVANDFTSGLCVWTIDSVWAVSAATIIGPDPAVYGLALWLDTAGSVLVLRGRTSQLSLGVLTAGGVVSIALTTIASPPSANYITGCSLSVAEGVAFVDDATSLYAVRFNVSGGTISATTPEALARGLRPCAAAFAYAGEAYCPATWSSTLQSVCMVVSAAGSVVAKTEPGLCGGHRSDYAVAATHEADGVFSFASSVKTQILSDGGTFYSRIGVERVTVDFTSSYRYASAELGGNLLLAGGVLHAYDGQTVTEAGFHFFPEGLTGTASGSGGSVDAGLHQYRVVYEWTDATGQIHRSAPSDVYEVTTAALDSVTLAIPTLRVTSKTGVRLVVYRTVAAGTTFYRISSLTSPTLNSKTAASVSYVDTASDASIESNDVIYTDGTANQELENIAPGACSLLTTHRGRAFVRTAPNRVSYSKLTFDGEPVAFNDGLYLLPDGRGGEITALAGMDDKLVIFKERAIFVAAGDGPSNTGAGDYAEPQLVTSDVGCDEPRSVVLTSGGLMFHSPKGIYLLDRSLSVTYIGAPVEFYNALTITSAVVVPSTNQVRFTTSGTVTKDDGSERSDLVLVYDYLMNQWSTFTGIAAVDATVWQGVYVWAKATGRTYEEDATTSTDDGAFVQLRFVTSWISLGQLNGFQRIYRLLILGDYKGSHSLRVRLGYDYRPEYTFDQSVDATTVVGPDTWGSDATWGSGATWGGEYPTEWFRVSPARQKCSAMRICVEDVQTTAYGEGFSITGIGLLAGVKAGVNKMAAERSV